MYYGKVTEDTVNIPCTCFANSEPEGEIAAKKSIFDSSENITESVSNYLKNLVEKSSNSMTQLQRQVLTSYFVNMRMC